MKSRFIASAAIILVFTVLSGCSTFELETGAICYDLEKSDTSYSETVHGSLWGFQWSDHVVEKCETGCGFYRVEFHTNAFFVMASVLSLGLYVPQTVEWWCQVRPRDDSDQPMFDPNETEGDESGQPQSSNKPLGKARKSP